MGRRAGLSRYSNPPPLLKKIMGRDVDEAKPSKRQKTDASSSSIQRRQDEGPIDRLPESSSDEDNEDDTRAQRRRDADIGPTTFTKGRPSKRDKATKTSGTVADKSSTITELKLPIDDNFSERDDADLKALRPKKAVKKYGDPNIQRRKVTQAKRTSKQSDAHTSTGKKDASSVFKHISDDEFDLSSSPHKGGFQGEVPKILGSPDRRVTLKPCISSPNSSPHPLPFKDVGPMEASPKKEAAANLPKGKVRRPKKVSRKRATDDDLSQKPLFTMPDLDDFDGVDVTNSQSTPSALGDLQVGGLEDEELQETNSMASTRCPMCNDVVDPELFKKHCPKGKMNISRQTAFCRLHRRLSAFRTETDKGYPKIHWDVIEDRCLAQVEFLKDILEKNRSSHYREVFKEKVESGKNRTLLTNQDNLTPGYYGPRGLRVMTEFIMRTLTSVIRKQAVEDRLLSARSYTGYVQAVLVPELTVRLIMEDLSTTEDKARDILEESAEIGELLHEEKRDVVKSMQEKDRQTEDI
ncbi:RTC4-like domain-containing protein [Xylariaceae sp. FL1019]|nr:RTC4-like domain-containing protein [Xylariaceae sp. FL1019]